MERPSTPNIPAGFKIHVDGNGIEAKGWVITSRVGRISSSDDIDRFYDETSVKCPEMPYLGNFLQLEHLESGFLYNFSAVDALKACRIKAASSATVSHESGAQSSADIDANTTTTPSPSNSNSNSSSSSASDTNLSLPLVEVSMADIWKNKQAPIDMQTLETTFDWTYSSRYAGAYTCKNRNNNVSVEECNLQLDMNLLRSPDPILWYNDVRLFDDELHDNGISTMAVKIRVMPTFWLCLLRFFLRVDGVLVRIIDTRLFHSYETNFLQRDFTIREATMAQLREMRMPTESLHYKDPNKFCNRLPVSQIRTEKLEIQMQTNTK